MINAGVSFKLGQKDTVTKSRITLTREVDELKQAVSVKDREVDELKAAVAKQSEQINALMQIVNGTK